MNVLDKRIVGTAVQLGLMHATGYFSDWPTRPCPPDWAVTAIEPTSDRGFPWRVDGINLNVPPGEYGHRFSWCVPRLCWRYRFELCAAAGGAS